MAWLEVAGLQAGYGGNQVLHGIQFELEEGRILSLLGRNGMGKTTTLKCLMGLIVPKAGTLRLGQRTINGLAAHEVARLGVGWVPEGRQIFPTLTVEENLLATAADRHRAAQP
ncbi:MAG TPA: ATP-binding cassette domain-containing protein, partial [Ottowia sp.]|nr:ATP-binding cassette domain-containing protein [Ottowia sp.]